MPETKASKADPALQCPGPKGESVSVIIPMKDESASIEGVVKGIRAEIPAAEILVVDDGSSDNCADLAEQAGATVIRNPVSLGNGGAIKAGVRAANGQFIVCMDADGQHQPTEIKHLLSGFSEGFDLIVGMRDAKGQASFPRRVANGVYNIFASFVVGQTVKDLTSGFRAFRAQIIKDLLPLLPNGFSYPTTSLVASYRLGFQVKFVPINVLKREGSSHISPLKDGIRFLIILFRIATLYSPLKVFIPVSTLMALSGIANYAITYFTDGRFTNMSVVMLVASIVVFVIGLVSEQVTTLLFVYLSDRSKK